jgi:hypothetical protein
MAAQRKAASGAEAIFTRVDRGAARTRGDARLAQDGDGLARGERGFDRTQLGIDLREGGELREHERVVALPEAVEVEDETPEVAVGELPRLAQEACATAHAAARAEACGGLGWGRDAGARGLLRVLGGGRG